MYTLLAVATICSIEMPIFIMPRGAIDLTTNSVMNSAANNIGTPTDAKIDSPLDFVGPDTTHQQQPTTTHNNKTENFSHNGRCMSDTNHLLTHPLRPRQPASTESPALPNAEAQPHLHSTQYAYWLKYPGLHTLHNTPS